MYESYDTSQNQAVELMGLSPSRKNIPEKTFLHTFIHISCIPRLARDPDAILVSACTSDVLSVSFAVQGPSTNVEHWFWTSARLKLGRVSRWVCLKMGYTPNEITI